VFDGPQGDTVAPDAAKAAGARRWQHVFLRKSVHVEASGARAHLGSHHLKELIEVDGAGAVSVDVGDHLLDLLLLGLEAEGAHGNLELLGIDRAGAVSVEKVEGLADLLLLLLGEGEPVEERPCRKRGRRKRPGGTPGAGEPT
jgi:hypothetical protein